eukprot:4467602-Prymnesium_polylepis.2
MATSMGSCRRLPPLRQRSGSCRPEAATESQSRPGTGCEMELSAASCARSGRAKASSASPRVHSATLERRMPASWKL